MFVGLASMATAQVAPATRPAGGRIAFADGRISFVPPVGFTELDAEWLAAKFPHPNPPRRAVGNPRRTTTIAYDQMDGSAPSEDLEALRKAMLASFSPLPKLRWVASDVRTVGGHRWAYLEFTSAAADQDIHNIVLLTVSAGRLVLFNFNSTTREFATVEAELRASMASIRVKS